MQITTINQSTIVPDQSRKLDGRDGLRRTIVPDLGFSPGPPLENSEELKRPLSQIRGRSEATSELKDLGAEADRGKGSRLGNGLGFRVLKEKG
ncbi:hypothetical protein Cni_G16280 [Canna indica]|uniref:Uncharacterized protein n=1 Tax=Canna indica TaxID=4628 RepID=A0AAQ3QCF4_9LILI|nr:hypothetical protein Cni_G16280 [Canna indica]